jgi:hypothetical protein
VEQKAPQPTIPEPWTSPDESSANHREDRLEQRGPRAHVASDRPAQITRQQNGTDQSSPGNELNSCDRGPAIAPWMHIAVNILRRCVLKVREDGMLLQERIKFKSALLEDPN